MTTRDEAAQEFEQLLRDATASDRAKAVGWVHPLHQARGAANEAGRVQRDYTNLLKHWLALAGEAELYDEEHHEGVRVVPGNTSRWVDYSALTDEQVAWLVRHDYLSKSITRENFKRLNEALDTTALDIRPHIHEGQGEEKLVLFKEGES